MRTYWGVLTILVVFACQEDPQVLNTTKLGDTMDHVGPYWVTAVVSAPTRLDEVRLIYSARIDLSNVSNSVEMKMEEVRTGVYQGAIPGQGHFTHISYHVQVSGGDAVISDPPGALLSEDEWYSFWVLGAKCKSEMDCGPGENCDGSGVCVISEAPCERDADCGKGFRCGADALCHQEFRSCVLDEGCLIGEVCDLLVNQCMPRPRCDESFSCPSDFKCIDDVCRRSCVGESDCGPGEVCVPLRKYCSKPVPCSDEEPCDEGLVCDAVSELCRPQGADLCAPCTRDLECGGPTDFCLIVGGTRNCGQDCSDNECPEGYICEDIASPPQCLPSSGACEF
ncbi:MAG: hypothetical protein V1754_14960 [Pseudomonadota bacterium]